MSEIAVTSLIASSGSVPSSGYDPVSNAGYIEWELNDEARFSVKVPDKYRAGSDFSITIMESTPSAQANHKWRISTLLMRPGINATDEATEMETFTAEYQSSSGSDELTKRVITVTGSGNAGEVSDVAIAPGDVLSFTMKRTAASADEDTAAIKVFNLDAGSALSETSLSDCSGRVGTIIDTVRDLFNEAAAGFLPEDFIIRSINRCRQDLAQEGYWRREAWIPSSSGQNEVDLLTLLNDFQDIHQVRFSGVGHPMSPLPSYREYVELKTDSNTAGTPECYIVANNKMCVWPPPAKDLQSGFGVYYSYLPPDLTCSAENPDPSVPKAHDMVFVYFVLQQAFLRDRHAPGADTKFREYQRLYEREKRNLLGEGETANMLVRPYRDT
jgi:hypothetical protein